ANRGGGERLFLEALKQIFRVAPEFIDQHFPNERVVHGRRVEVKTFEGGENFRGKNSGKAHDRLTRLHQGAAHIAQPVNDLQGDSQIRFQLALFFVGGAREPSSNTVQTVSQRHLNREFAHIPEALERARGRGTHREILKNALHLLAGK